MSIATLFNRLGTWFGWEKREPFPVAAPEPSIGQSPKTQPVPSVPPQPVQAQGPTTPQDADGNSLLDDLFRATISYRNSKAYFDLLDYIVRFRRYSPYNCLLVRLQRPTVGYVATPSDWMTEFERKVKPDARPLMMLRPFGPVMFVFDIEDTEGKPAPPDLMRPFDAQGQLNPSVWSYTVMNAGHDGISVMGRSGWRTAWRNLREEAAKGDKDKGKPEMTRLASLCFYDLRHQFVTELCEAGVPEAVIRELGGHVDPQMMRIYSHPRLAAKRLAVEALATVKTGQSEGGYVTNHVTKGLPAGFADAEVIEKNGRGAQI